MEEHQHSPRREESQDSPPNHVPSSWCSGPTHPLSFTVKDRPGGSSGVSVDSLDSFSFSDVSDVVLLVDTDDDFQILPQRTTPMGKKTYIVYTSSSSGSSSNKSGEFSFSGCRRTQPMNRLSYRYYSDPSDTEPPSIQSDGDDVVAPLAFTFEDRQPRSFGMDPPPVFIAKNRQRLPGFFTKDRSSGSSTEADVLGDDKFEILPQTPIGKKTIGKEAYVVHASSCSGSGSNRSGGFSFSGQTYSPRFSSEDRRPLWYTVKDRPCGSSGVSVDIVDTETETHMVVAVNDSDDDLQILPQRTTPMGKKTYIVYTSSSSGSSSNKSGGFSFSGCRRTQPMNRLNYLYYSDPSDTEPPSTEPPSIQSDVVDNTNVLVNLGSPVASFSTVFFQSVLPHNPMESNPLSRSTLVRNRNMRDLMRSSSSSSNSSSDDSDPNSDPNSDTENSSTESDDEVDNTNVMVNLDTQLAFSTAFFHTVLPHNPTESNPLSLIEVVENMRVLMQHYKVCEEEIDFDLNFSAEKIKYLSDMCGYGREVVVLGDEIFFTQSGR